LPDPPTAMNSNVASRTDQTGPVAGGGSAVQNALDAALREGGIELLPMPQVAARIVSLAFDAKSDATDLAELIGRDPTLAGHLMRVANSALYRARSPLSSLQQAVTWLGMEEVQNLAVALAIRGQVFTAPGHEKEVEELWRESIGAAAWARLIAESRGQDADVAYLCGLLHAVGRAAVVRALSRYESASRTRLDGRSFAVLLDEYEGDFAHRISGDWRLPPQVAAAVTAWRSFETAGEFCDHAALTHASVQLAIACMHPDLLNVDYLSSNPAFARLGLTNGLGTLLTHADAVRAFILQL